MLVSLVPDGDTGNLAVLLGATGTKRVQNIFGEDHVGRVPNLFATAENKRFIAWYRAVECT